LSERFGLWLSFYPFRQEDFLDIVDHWLVRFGVDPAAAGEAHARPAVRAGTRLPLRARCQQFARDFAGRAGLG